MKKVAFVTHSFHKKTLSINNLVEEIFNKNDYAPEYLYIEDWTDNAAGLNEYIEGYDIVVIIQLISLEILHKIKCDNIVFIPMYDFCQSWDVFKWLECSNLKILSLTKTIQDQISKIGFNSYQLKYYPAPAEFMPGDLSKIYLWQRINDINIKTTLQLLNNFPIAQIYLHNAIDPHHTFVSPSEAEIIKYKIMMSTWFENKSEYLNILKNIGIYIAPRLMEGGASAFIDAMKMGKVVIANNNAAMNEYITHNETGLLYDAHNIHSIDYDSIDLHQIQKNAYESVKEGYNAWRKSIPNVLDFIENKSKISIFIPLTMLKTIRDSRETLRQEKNALTTEIKQIQISLSEDKWYKFGKLSRKDKIKKVCKIILKKLLLSPYFWIYRKIKPACSISQGNN